MPHVRFHKVLVANRGEIARRIFHTLREMGLETVAVFSDADREAPHTLEADEAVRLGPAPSAQSYLDQDAVIAAAKAVGADAIHPGYGFLAENASFAERCGEEGLVFVGPSPEAMRRMGNKAEAKALAKKVGVPVLEGFSLEGLDLETSRQSAEDLGFPLLLKAAAGGGGKGMRVVSNADDLDSAIRTAAREAEGAFGDRTLLIERLVASPRHVEVQIFGDAHGHIVHCFERDCSVQRRYQKVFEESPSPAVSAELRERLGEAAVTLARAVDYRGAGTIEFLLEPSGAFFFLEMNTRLQVEHPVTEAVTGLDLVRLQIEVAQGLPLGLDQSDLRLLGHAIEARLYAEDPANDFLPATGTVALWAPPELPGLRIDSGVEPGVEVGIHYDPMLAKVIAHGSTRDEALRRLHRGLAELAVGGLTTNREFLLAVLEHHAFSTGDFDTAFLDRQLPGGSRLRATSPEILELHAIAAMLHLFDARRQQPRPFPADTPSGWRNNRYRPQEEIFEHGDRRLAVRYMAHRDDGFKVTVADSEAEDVLPERTVRLVSATDGVLIAEVDGVRRRFQVARHPAGRSLSVHGLARVSELQRVPRFPEHQAAAVAGGCVAPMTGRVVQVLVAEGDRVEAGDPLLILEAMKMEHRLVARTHGIVQAVRVNARQMVDPDEVLVVVTPIDCEQEGSR